MFFKKLFLFFIAISFAGGAAGASHYSFNQACLSAYNDIALLNFTEANRKISAELAAHPNNVAADMLGNLSDCLSLFITEDQKEFERIRHRMDDRLDKVEKLDKKSPHYRYCVAEISFQWAVLKLKFGENYTAALLIRKGYKLMEENNRLFPSFLPNKKYLGLMHAAIGMAPDQYKWLVSIAGFRGTLAQGLKEIRELAYCSDASEFSYLRRETRLLLAFVQLNFQKDPKQASAIAEELYSQHKGPLELFLKAVVASHSGHSDEVISLLSPVEDSRPYYFPYFDYMLGNARLYRLDKKANVSYERYLATFRGRNYLKATRQKLAWYYLINGSEQLYREHISKVRTTGHEFVDEDKQAQREAVSGEIPNLVLLKARLLCDGGYYSQALAQFVGTNVNEDFPTLRDQLEVTYRVARIYHKLGEYTKAMEHYQETLKNGYHLPYYFAANSSLQLGLIYEEKKNFSQARFYYEKCLSMPAHEYQNSIDQKAKAGLSRTK